KKQYRYKLKANIDSLSSLVSIQLVALILSAIAGNGSSGGSNSNGFEYYATFYSADIVITFTFIWAFTTAITITTKAYRNHDFSFITNRTISSLSNVLFLATISLLGSTTAILSENLLKIIAFFRFGNQIYTFQTGMFELVTSICATFLYVFL